VTNSPPALENQYAVPEWPAIDIAPRSLTDTPTTFAAPSVLLLSSSMAAGERPSLRAARCVGSISVSLSTSAPFVSSGYAASSTL
jgi:hypothetical protein